MKTHTNKTPRTNRTTKKPLAEIQEAILRFWGWKKDGLGWVHKDWLLQEKNTKFGDLQAEDLMPQLRGWFEMFEKLWTPKGLEVHVALTSIGSLEGRKYVASWRNDDTGLYTTIAFVQNTPEEAMTRLYHAAIQAGCTVATEKPAAVKAVRRSKSSKKISKVK